MSLLSPQLQAFMAVANKHTVHAAADSLHLTQTAVTQRLRVLERQLGISLFTRRRRGMELTEEGHALLRYCQGTLELEQEALGTIQGGGQTKTVQVILTGPSSLMRSRVIPACIDVMKHFGQLLLEFNISDNTEGAALLREGKTHLQIIEPHDVAREMQAKVLEPEHYVLIAPIAWQHRNLEDIIQNERIIDFNPADKMTMDYLKHFDLYINVKPERHFVNEIESLTELVKQQQGYGVITTPFCKEFIDSGALCLLNEGKTYSHDIRLAWYDRPEMPAYLKALIDAIH